MGPPTWRGLEKLQRLEAEVGVGGIPAVEKLKPWFIDTIDLKNIAFEVPLGNLLGCYCCALACQVGAWGNIPIGLDHLSGVHARTQGRAHRYTMPTPRTLESHALSNAS